MNIETVHTMDRGLAYAEACFETFLVVDGVVFDWHAHAARLQRGMDAFGIVLSAVQLHQMHMACLQAAKQCGTEREHTLIRLTVSGGDAAWGLFNSAEAINVRIQSMPYACSRVATDLKLMRWASPPAQRIAKFTADYAATLRILRGQQQVLLEHDGLLLSAATANIMLLKDGQWWTPEVTDGVLPGVIRQHLLDMGLVREASCPVSWLNDCTAMVITASSFFVRPVHSMIKADGVRLLEDHSLACMVDLYGAPGVPEDVLNA